MDLKSALPSITHPIDTTRRVAMHAPGTGPAPHLRRRVIARMPGIGLNRRIRWQTGTVVPGVGPTARIRRRGRAVASRGKLIGAAGLAGAAAVAFAKRRSHNGEASEEPAGAPGTER